MQYTIDSLLRIPHSLDIPSHLFPHHTIVRDPTKRETLDLMIALVRNCYEMPLTLSKLIGSITDIDHYIFTNIAKYLYIYMMAVFSVSSVSHDFPDSPPP